MSLHDERNQDVKTGKKVRSVRDNKTRIGVALGGVLLLLTLIFILQNQKEAHISFLWMHGNMPLAIALLLAAVTGAVGVLLLGMALYFQKKRVFKRV